MAAAQNSESASTLTADFPNFAQLDITEWPSDILSPRDKITQFLRTVTERDSVSLVAELDPERFTLKNTEFLSDALLSAIQDRARISDVFIPSEVLKQFLSLDIKVEKTSDQDNYPRKYTQRFGHGSRTALSTGLSWTTCDSRSFSDRRGTDKNHIQLHWCPLILEIEYPTSDTQTTDTLHKILQAANNPDGGSSTDSTAQEQCITSDESTQDGNCKFRLTFIGMENSKFLWLMLELPDTPSTYKESITTYTYFANCMYRWLELTANVKVELSQPCTGELNKNVTRTQYGAAAYIDGRIDVSHPWTLSSRSSKHGISKKAITTNRLYTREEQLTTKVVVTDNIMTKRVDHEGWMYVCGCWLGALNEETSDAPGEREIERIKKTLLFSHVQWSLTDYTMLIRGKEEVVKFRSESEEHTQIPEFPRLQEPIRRKSARTAARNESKDLEIVDGPLVFVTEEVCEWLQNETKTLWDKETDTSSIRDQFFKSLNLSQDQWMSFSTWKLMAAILIQADQIDALNQRYYIRCAFFRCLQWVPTKLGVVGGFFKKDEKGNSRCCQFPEEATKGLVIRHEV